MDLTDLLKKIPLSDFDDILKETGLNKDDLNKVIKKGLPEVVKNGSKTAGNLLDNLEIDYLAKEISKKVGIEYKKVELILKKLIPIIKEKFDLSEILDFVKSFSNGIDFKDIGKIFDTFSTDKKGNNNGSLIGKMLKWFFKK